MNEKYYVVRGAELKCAFGDQSSKLQMPMDHGVFVDRDAQANLMDNKPMINILPFGQCNAPLNPTLIAAKAASSGAVQKVPCIPVTVAPWIGAKMDALVGKLPAVTDASCLLCAWMGRITVENAGQKLESDKSPATMEAAAARVKEQREAEQAAQNYQAMYQKDPAAAKAMLKAERSKKMATLTGAGGSKGTGSQRLENPLDDPRIAKEIQADSNAVYGYSPKPGTPLSKFNVDWSDPEQVAFARGERIKYHQKLAVKKKQLEEEVVTMQKEGKSMEDIARIKVEQRNQDRINSYIKSGNMEGLQSMRERNLLEYQRAEGPTADQLFAKKGSWEEVVFGSVRTSPAMDVLTGLY